MTEQDRCTWCRQPGHIEGDHPLPKDHSQYDAFYDAPDEDLAVMVSNAVWPNGQRIYPEASA